MRPGLVGERVTRIELAYSAWEADVLPLNYTRIVVGMAVKRRPDRPEQSSRAARRPHGPTVATVAPPSRAAHQANGEEGRSRTATVETPGLRLGGG